MSDLRVNTISAANGTGPVTLTKQSAAKQWVNINAVPSTPSLENSHNVSTVSDIDTGNFEFNAISSFSNVKYSGAGCHDVYTARAGGIESSVDRGNTTSKVKVRVNNSSGAASDSREIMFTTHGDLA